MNTALPARLLLSLGRASQRILRFDAPFDIDAPELERAYFEKEVRDGRAFVATLPELSGCVLDLGCGYGGLLEVLVERGLDAVGVDVDRRRVELAARRGLAAVVGDAQALPFSDQSFDAIVSYAVLEHIPDIDRAFAEVRRVLKPGGRLYAEWGPPWLAFNGPHLIKALGIPWVHLLFPRRVIVAALELQRERCVWPASYLDYKLLDYASIGRNTRRKVRRAARRAGLVIEEESTRSPNRLKNRLARVAPFDELLPGALRLVLRRD